MDKFEAKVWANEILLMIYTPGKICISMNYVLTPILHIVSKIVSVQVLLGGHLLVWKYLAV